MNTIVLSKHQHVKTHKHTEAFSRTGVKESPIGCKGKWKAAIG